MKLLWITSTFPTPARPFQGAFNGALVTALRQRHHVDVIAPMPWHQVPWIHRAALTVHASMPQTGSNFHPTLWHLPRLSRKQLFRRYEHCVDQVMQRIDQAAQYDAVISYWIDPDGRVANGVAKTLGVPSVVMSGGSDLRILARQPDLAPVVAKTLRDADHVVVVSRELKEIALNELGLSADDVTILRRGIDHQIFRPLDRAECRKQLGIRETSRMLLWVGRLESVKRPLLALEILRDLLARGLDVDLWMVGDGRLKTQVKQRMRRLGLSDHVTLKAACGQHELSRLYNASDLVTLTSHSEGIPNVLLEAIRCGARMVASDVGGIPEILDASCDSLVPVDDAQSFSLACWQQLQKTDASVARRWSPESLDESAEAWTTLLQAVTGTGDSTGAKVHPYPLVLPECLEPRHQPLCDREAS